MAGNRLLLCFVLQVAISIKNQKICEGNFFFFSLDIRIPKLHLYSTKSEIFFPCDNNCCRSIFEHLRYKHFLWSKTHPRDLSLSTLASLALATPRFDFIIQNLASVMKRQW